MRAKRKEVLTHSYKPRSPQRVIKVQELTGRFRATSKSIAEENLNSKIMELNREKPLT